jgi:hypothetical protein
MPLRDFCAAQGWEVYREYVGQAPANDLLHRVQWRQLLDDAAKRRFSAVLVFKLDRAFRSVKHMHDTLAAWELVGVSFQSYRERFDTSTALGRLLLNLLASLAEFELELIRERVKAGMEWARRQGKKIGRPRESPERVLPAFWRHFGTPYQGRNLPPPGSEGAEHRLRHPEASAGRPRQGTSGPEQLAMAGKRQSLSHSGPENGLTPIPPGIHYPATTERVGGKDELDEIVVEHFLDTLSKVALAIASRKQARERPGGEVGP